MSRGATRLALGVAPLATLASAAGIFAGGGPGPWDHVSVRGHTVAIYGRGLYRHMSAEVAPQGIAQDVVTLLIAVPLLGLAWWHARAGGIRARLFLAGVLAYFFVTYLFYLAMGAYNVLFLVYVALLGLSAFALGRTLIGLDPAEIAAAYLHPQRVRPAGSFLAVIAVAIAVLWLSIVVPPLADGTIVPREVEHYTTLIVQGFDLALLLPLGFVTGIQMRRGTAFGLLVGPVYLVFLALLMTALSAKVAAMAALGYDAVPAIVLIPVSNAAACYYAVRTFRAMRDEDGASRDPAAGCL